VAVADGEPDAALLADDAAWAACIAGAMTRDRYRSQLEGAGFVDVELVDSHAVADGFWSVLVRAANRARRSPPWRDVANRSDVIRRALREYLAS
jgi:hypothetical protein